jgi:hypothetical protein
MTGSRGGTYLASAYSPHSRPMPDCLKPPKGIWGSIVFTQLTQAEPAFRPCATRSARWMSFENTAAASPYVVSFAAAITSAEHAQRAHHQEGAERQRTLLCVERNDDANGPEDLLADDAHFRLDVREDRRPDEQALVTVPLSPEVDRGTVLLAGVDVAHDALQDAINTDARRG